MKNLRFWGATAAFVDAASYVFGFVLLFGFLAGSGIGSDQPNLTATTAFLVENQGLMSLWYLTIYVLNGLALAALAVALRARFAAAAPGLAQAVLTFGALWATLVVGAGMVANVGIGMVAALHPEDAMEAARLWRVVELVEGGLGGGNEIAGAIWALLVGAAGLASRTLPRSFAWFSIVIGGAGLATLLPSLNEIAGAVFGLGYIGWFVWIGLVLARRAA